MSTEQKILSLVQELNYASSSNVFVAFSPGPEVPSTFILFSESDSEWIAVDRNDFEVIPARGGLVLCEGDVDAVRLDQSEYLLAHDARSNALLFEREVYELTEDKTVVGLKIIWEAEA